MINKQTLVDGPKLAITKRITNDIGRLTFRAINKQ